MPTNFLIASDEYAHIEAVGRAGEPFWRHNHAFLDLLKGWHPSPEVWAQPAAAVASAAEAIAAAPSVDGDTKLRFASASPADRAAILYDHRNVPDDRSRLGNELVEAWLLQHAAVREPLDGGDARVWPVPLLTRGAWAARRTVLMQAVALQCLDDYVPMLVAAGETVSARDPQGATALHWAAASAFADLDVPYGFTAEALVKAGAELDAPDNKGRTPLDVAIARRNWAVVRSLVCAEAFVTDEQWGAVLRMGERLGWHEPDEWKCRLAARSLDGVLARPGAGLAGGRVRM